MRDGFACLSCGTTCCSMDDCSCQIATFARSQANVAIWSRPAGYRTVRTWEREIGGWTTGKGRQREGSIG